jgi:lysophospholipase L1-like esterase
MENAVSAGAATLHDPAIFFIPTTGGANGAWMTGTGSTAAPHGDGNCDVYISSDNVHPNDAGHAYLAGRMADEIMRQVLKA